MGAPTGSAVVRLTKPWRGYPSVNAVHGIRAHIQQDPTKYTSQGLIPSAPAGAGHFALKPGGAGVHVGTIPMGAIVLPLAHHLLVAFSPASTLNVGTINASGVVSAGFLTLTGAAMTTPAFTGGVSSGALMGYQAAQVEVYVQITGTGDAVTGELDLLIPFYIQKD